MHFPVCARQFILKIPADPSEIVDGDLRFGAGDEVEHGEPVQLTPLSIIVCVDLPFVIVANRGATAEPSRMARNTEVR